jgi:hypothetical protein
LSVAAIFLGSGIDEYIIVIFLMPRNIEAPRNVPYFPIVKARFLKKNERLTRNENGAAYKRV